jgi:hypothetical protein
MKTELICGRYFAIVATFAMALGYWLTGPAALLLAVTQPSGAPQYGSRSQRETPKLPLVVTPTSR